MNKIGISIIIPCYNVEKYIEKCLNSIKEQVDKLKYEIILVDDKSTDNTVRIIEKYIKKNKTNISFIKNEINKGAGYSRNKALKQAKFDYISFIDADDYLDDNFYSELLSIVENTNCDVVVCDIKSIYEDGSPSIVVSGCEGKIDSLNLINTSFAASPCNKIIKKELLLKYPFPEGIMNEDIATIISILANSQKIEYTSQTRYNYIQRFSSVQNSSFSEKRFDLFKSIDILEERIKNNKDYPKIMKIITFQQLFLFFIYVIPREENIFKRANYLKKFRKQSAKYNLENNDLCFRDLKRRGKKANFYYKMLFNLNNKGLSFPTSLIIQLFNIYHNIKYSKLLRKKLSVIKNNIEIEDIIKEAKKQNRRKKENISVSVVVPNYNYEKFLYQRIYSILYQDYKIEELIILDDCSSDNSKELIDSLVNELKPYINIKSCYNEINSGTAFKQWKLGFELAKSDYVWIAEADDYCDKKLLSSLIKPIESEKSIVISYADTAFVDENGIKRLKTIKPEIDILNTGHWNEDFINDGISEIKNYCYLNCTIANVSSCIIKNDNYKKYLTESSNYKQAGDWLFYINVLKNGKIAFKNKTLNYYRVHGNNVSSVMKKGMHINEIKKIHQKLIKEFKLNKSHEINMRKRIEFLEDVWGLK